MNLGRQKFYGHGKLLLTGEYVVMNGAKAVALPTNYGQSMHVAYRRTHEPKLIWKSYDNNSELWFEATFELWHFNLLSEINERSLFLQNILRKARSQNVHFLRDDVDILVDCHLEFGVDWGLGSSSTLIYNIAQWAYISAFELHRNLGVGSGYDLACAQAVGPIFYQLKTNGANWGTLNFDPMFKENIYFIYLNKKKSTSDEIDWFKKIVPDVPATIIESITKISEKIVRCFELKEFEQLLLEHESIISGLTGMPRVQDLLFGDYPGVIKSLGAWGGDFVLATSLMDENETKNYFLSRGYEIVLTYDEMIYQKFDGDLVVEAALLQEGAATYEH